MSTDDSEPITEGVDPRQGDLLELLEGAADTPPRYHYARQRSESSVDEIRGSVGAGR